MRKLLSLGLLAAAASVVVLLPSAVSRAAGGGIHFETPAIADPIHTFGEPTIGVDPQGRVFVSGPTGTGTQRSAWGGSVDGGHSFRVITPGAPPTSVQSIEDPPGGGDTDLNFDRSSRQYFADLYALTCLRVARTDDGGATVAESPDGCGVSAGADRQWLAVYDPAPGTPHDSATPGRRRSSTSSTTTSSALARTAAPSGTRAPTASRTRTGSTASRPRPRPSTARSAPTGIRRSTSGPGRCSRPPASRSRTARRTCF